MNFYKHHIGDYAAATEHLSWDEDQAYTRLLRVYYRDERPIPAEVAKACRLVRATTAAQRAAVETVLGEFFVLQDDGWHNKRADAEIVSAQDRAAFNREVGKKGGRPSKAQTQSVTNSEPVRVNGRNPNGLNPKPKRNPIQTPDSNSHTPDIGSLRFSSPGDLSPSRSCGPSETGYSPASETPNEAASEHIAKLRAIVGTTAKALKA